MTYVIIYFKPIGKRIIKCEDQAAANKLMKSIQKNGFVHRYEDGIGVSISNFGIDKIITKDVD